MNDSQLEALKAESLYELQQQSSMHLVMMLYSWIDLINNTFVIVTIFFSKSLHNKSQFVILSHCTIELLLALIYICTGTVRYLSYVYSSPYYANQFVCTLRQLPISFGGNVVQIYTLGLACDRFMCVALPLFYKHLRTGLYVVAFNVVCFGLTVVKMSFVFYDINTAEMFPTCSYSSYNDQYKTMDGITENIATIATVSIYALAAVVLLVRYKLTKFNGDLQRRDWKKSMEFDVFFAILVIGAIYVATIGANSIISLFTLSLQFENQVGAIVSALYLTSGETHLFVYLYLNSTFRKAFKLVILKKEHNTVIPMGALNHFGLINHAASSSNNLGRR